MKLSELTKDREVEVIDGPKYVVVIDRTFGLIYRVRKPRVGLMRFSRERGA